MSPYSMAGYLRGRRVQQGMLIRSLVVPAAVALFSLALLPESPDPEDYDLSGLVALLMVSMSLVILLVTAISGPLLYLLGKIVGVYDLRFIKSMAISGWAGLLSILFSLLISVGFPEYAGIVFGVIFIVLISLAWKKACRATPENIISLWVFAMLLGGLTWMMHG